MLTLYETFQQHKVPKSLQNEIYGLDNDKLDTIENFSKVNIFIGPNNSGKSKLIRELIKQKPAAYYGKVHWLKITELINQIFLIVDISLRKIYTSQNSFVISNPANGEIINSEDINGKHKKFLEYSSNYDLESTIKSLEHSFITVPNSINRTQSFVLRRHNSVTVRLEPLQNHAILKILDEIKDQVSPLIEQLKKYQFSSLAQNDIPRIYIPSIRTLRPFAETANITEQTKNEYEFNESIIIYNGQDLPKEIDDLANTEYSNRQKLIQFQELLSKEFFASKPVKLTYHRRRNVLLIKIGEEIERPIHELGDGLQMIIILTFPFFANTSGLIAIEEPELFIHPGLQKTFIKFLISHIKTRDFQILLATHSNHIIDSINQSELISLFSIRKKEKTSDSSMEKIPDFIIENLAHGNENFLNLLGITNTSVYLANCTIWVEGITDKLYIQKFIFEYLKTIDKSSVYAICKEYKEGINYSFSLTGGDSIIHWDFSDETEYLENTKNIIVRKFCSKSLIIVDNDFGKNVKRKNILKELLQERFIELKQPEIENLLSQEVINDSLLTYPSVKRAVGQNKLPNVDRKIFRSNKIGSIIDNVILKDYPSKIFSAKGGEKSSLKSGDKYIFCNKALDYIRFETLTNESKKLVEQILDFIISRNNFL